jgi:pyrroline-5-carboxylate reductase
MKIVLIGCGNMGGALLRGWVSAGIAPIYVIDPDVTAMAGAEILDGVEALSDLAKPICLVLAVKPAMATSILARARPYLQACGLVISVAAGVSLASLRVAGGPGPSIVRTMPNTPAAIGRGAIGAVSDLALSVEDHAFAQKLLSAAGQVFWLEREALIDAVTAISGSGPAYFYRFTELLAQAGRDLGLPDAMADDLARLTFTGAAAWLDASQKPAAQLRREVTSPNGVTAAALAEFDREDRFLGLVREATRVAVRRNREMGH